MNIRSSKLDSDLLSDLKAICNALRLLSALAFGVVLLFLIFWWDASTSRPFVEAGPTELIQSCALALSSGIFLLEARRCPDLRGSMLLVSGFIGCMFIREQDYFLDNIVHGFWKWPALALAFSCMACAARTFRTTVAGLAWFVRWRYFPVLLTGLAVVLVYSRLFGMSSLWRELLPDGDWRMAKTAIEESSELLGYMLIVFSSVLFLFRDHRES